MNGDRLAIDKFLSRAIWANQARQIDFGYDRTALLFPPHYVLVPTSGEIDLEASKQAARELAISFRVQPGLIVWGKSEPAVAVKDLEVSLRAEGFINFWLD